MRVSFVIPTRNQAGYIRKCIDMCLAQELSDFEVLVFDGLSTDGTQDVLASYGDRIRWVSEKDSGQSEAVNKGVNAATGELIAWINSDDYYPHADVLKHVLELFEGDPELDIVYGDGLMVDSEGRAIRKFQGRPLASLKQLISRPIGHPLQPAAFFRKHLFEAVGGLDPHLHLGLDYDLWLKMFPLARKYLYTPQCLACATAHATAKSVASMLPQIRELGMLKRRYSPRYGMGIADRFRMRLGMLTLYAYWAAVRLKLWRGS